ncbi:MAG: SEC-C metal-binding domain-containing protein [Candidatus Sulfopaludibacter sp.]|nr:SEC-C metal-binding domain-containing protein [Candidatus Sulfopaludibacter sp.]
MLFPPESHRTRLLDIAKERATEGADSVSTAHELLAIDPDYASAYSVLGKAAAKAGNFADAERFFWKGLELQPFGSLQYAGLAQVYRANPRTEPAADIFFTIALWAVALRSEVPEEFAQSMQTDPEGSGFDHDDPDTYRVIAESQEPRLKPEAVPEELSQRLRPYWLLNRLAVGALDGLSPEVLKEIRGEAASCVPVLHAALRAWARDPSDTHPEALQWIVALLGELAGPEILPDLWDLSNLRDNGIFLHAHWALCRMAVRHPEETIRSIRATLPGATTGVRCGMAEHLGLMPGAPDAPAAILALMKDFAQHATEDDASYLLLAAADALSEIGQRARSKELFVQFERLLNKDGRRWMRETMDEPEGFVPRIVAEELPDLDIEDVCLYRALMHDEDDEEDDLDDWDDDEEEFEEDEPPVVKPGRNDPCWCGSGKKYKKCHLDADEAAGRGEPGEPDLPDDPVRVEAMEGLLETAERIYKRREMLEAARQYFGDELPEEEDMATGSGGFFLWYLFDFRPKATGRTAIEEHLRKHGATLRMEAREALEAWRDSRYGLFEVVRATGDVSCELKDVYAGDTVVVDRMETASDCHPGEHFFARIEHWRGRIELSGEPLPVSSEALPHMRKFIAAESKAAGQTPAAFVRANIPRLHRLLEDL